MQFFYVGIHSYLPLLTDHIRLVNSVYFRVLENQTSLNQSTWQTLLRRSNSRIILQVRLILPSGKGTDHSAD
jgi:hypothetical protein